MPASKRRHREERLAELGPKGAGFVCGDSLDVLKRLPDGAFHLIVSDIPYGIGLDEWDVLHDNKNSALLGQSPAQAIAGSVFRRRGKPINGWSSADGGIPREYQEWCATWASEWLRVLAPGGSAIVFAGRRFASRAVVALEDAGFNFRDMLAWLKPHATHRAQRVSVVFEKRGDLARAEEWRGYRVGNLRPVFEPILWAQKPYRVTIADNLVEHEVGAWNETDFTRAFGAPNNAITCGFGAGEEKHHPAQKPLALMSGLIEMLTRPGQRVLDPFAGSGTTVVAAKKLGRAYLAIERDEAFCRVIADRLENER